MLLPSSVNHKFSITLGQIDYIFGNRKVMMVYGVMDVRLKTNQYMYAIYFFMFYSNRVLYNDFF